VEDAFMECENLPVLEDVEVTEEHVKKVAHMIRGSAGPSGTDLENWSNFLLRYGDHSKRLREAIAASIRRHANEVVEWNDIWAFLSRRGIALDKSPGVRPIGIGEVRQRIEAKVMVMITGIDLQEKYGADNLCVGTKAGIEGAIHAMATVMDADETEGMLLVDAKNAFNSLCREATLWNCRVYGQDVLDSFSICTEVILEFLCKEVMTFFSVKRELHKETLWGWIFLGWGFFL